MKLEIVHIIKINIKMKAHYLGAKKLSKNNPYHSLNLMMMKVEYVSMPRIHISNYKDCRTYENI